MAWHSVLHASYCDQEDTFLVPAHFDCQIPFIRTGTRFCLLLSLYRALEGPIEGWHCWWRHTSYLSPRSPIYRWRKNWSCGEISDFNTQQMWRNQKFCQIWRNFKILHMTDVKKSEIYPVFGCEICFVAIYAIFCLNCFVAIYALLCGKKLSRKLYRWRKNYKYEVW